MEMQQVRYFLALCDERNFTRAAERCGVSQPSLSRAIKDLENELGAPLFERSRDTTRPSRLGELIRPHLAEIDRSVARAQRAAAGFHPSKIRDSQPTERAMPRMFAGLFILAAILLGAGILTHASRPATALQPIVTRVGIDPFALHLKIDVKTLPEQELGDLV